MFARLALALISSVFFVAPFLAKGHFQPLQAVESRAALPALNEAGETAQLSAPPGDAPPTSPAGQQTSATGTGKTGASGNSVTSPTPQGGMLGQLNLEAPSAKGSAPAPTPTEQVRPTSEGTGSNAGPSVIRPPSPQVYAGLQASARPADSLKVCTCLQFPAVATAVGPNARQSLVSELKRLQGNDRRLPRAYDSSGYRK